ncbi:DUF1080 domain-containing protein [Dysgonomonas sp. Marseille-P4361]|uniref:DUF1080 domain-containing protein n=1 Tax=Dysgonomonas sp. Marseille-P4361 TaxID=2161820 RepID=UPI000D55128D|nr:DUF1080 domain-containing protein [Dysgonomonas sp. Marseille-P4361]
MKNVLTVLITICLLSMYSCSAPQSGDLFNGASLDNWKTSGDVAVEDGVLVLKGKESLALLKSGGYKDFILSMELRTVEKGKGSIGFHTGADGKGYAIALNNDMADPVWWRMTGSLMSVRNLTKSFVKDGDWFKMDIKVEGQAITVMINGEPVVEYIEPSKPFRNDINARSVLSEGTFSLVSSGEGALEFKNIAVDVLDRKDIDIAAQLSKAQDEQADPIIRLHQDDFPVLDYHVHLKGGLTKEGAAEQSRRLGINYVIAPNCGIGFPITDDAGIYDFLKTMRSEPFILAMQGEGREWVTTFSKEAREEFDFVFTDALTFDDRKGRRVRLWINDEVIIDDEQKYMDLIVEKTCAVLQEPADVFVNPFFLPEAMVDRYDEFWTEERMNKVIDALAKSGKALEINELYDIPNKALLMKAKEAGVKFTFGSNNVTPDVSDLAYSLRMKEECGLTPQDMYKPKIKIN